MADWRTVYLRALRVPVTPANLDFLAKWQPWEGGATHNNARFNYFNTTQRMPGSSSINSVGVQSYGSLAQGAQAFAKTLLGNKNYAGLVSELRAGKGVGGGATAALSTWVSGQPGSTSGLAYAQKVLGSAATAPTTAGAASPPQVGPSAPPAQFGQAQTAQQAADIGKQIKDAATQSLRDIAGGMKPTESFGGLADLIQTLKHAPKMQMQTDGQNGYQDAPAAGNSSLEAKAVDLVQGYLGINYVWGGENPKVGFDCSGLLQYVWRQLGVDIPRTTYDQWGAGQAVGQKGLKPGDAVFFRGSDPQGGKPGHVGMFIGNDRFIEAAHSGTTVRISRLSGRKDYVGARRFG